MNALKIKRKTLQKHLNGHLATIGLLVLAALIFLNNILFFHYHGNQYIPSAAFDFTLYMLAFYLISFGFSPLKTWRTYFQDGLSIGCCVLCVSFATNAIQLTPFRTIDHLLGKWELLPLTEMIIWTKNHQLIYEILTQIYNSLNYLLICIPISFILLQKKPELKAFYQFIMLTTMIGFSIYFFFPSCGPASFFPKELFEYYQVDNTLKFWEIHHGQYPSTQLGGLIAFPSFHVIWAYACVYPFKKASFFKLFIFFWFMMIIVSCVMLGWHYSLDIIGSLLIILITKILLEKNIKTWF